MKGLPKMRRVLYIFIACIMMFYVGCMRRRQLFGGRQYAAGEFSGRSWQRFAEDALVVYFSATGNGICSRGYC